MTDDLNTRSSEHEDLYSHLGQMVVSAASLELRLQLLARELCASRYSSHFIDGESSSKIIQLAGAIAKDHPTVTPDQLSKLQAILAECKELFERRHGYVHGVWIVNSADGPPEWPARQTARHTRRGMRLGVLSVEDLTDLIQRLGRVQEAIDDWILKKIITEQGAT
ncbi:hypothetical protein [Streptomyces wuyuanensis]|uniref:hypothetical protein n=1 Tax=Streptomyces wuyuanensis TaxID=1196353 RepID=UPI003798CB6E